MKNPEGGVYPPLLFPFKVKPTVNNALQRIYQVPNQKFQLPMNKKKKLTSLTRNLTFTLVRSPCSGVIVTLVTHQITFERGLSS